MKGEKENSFQLKGRTKALIAAVIVLIAVVGVLLFSFLGRGITNSVREQSLSALESVGSQNAMLVDAQIRNVQKGLHVIAGEIDRKGNLDEERILNGLKTYASNYSFYNMGVIDENGICYTTLDEVLDLSGYDYYKKGMAGERIVSEGYREENGDELLNIFTMPVEVNGKVKYILTATYRCVDFIRMTDVTSFSGHGRSVVLNESGRSVGIDGDFEGEHSETCKMACYVTEHPEALNGLTEGQKYFVISFDGEEYVAYCEKIQTNGWYLMTYVPSSYIYGAAKVINQNIWWIYLALYALIALLGAVFLIAYHKYQSRIVEALFRDNITGRKNYQFYRMNFQGVSEKEKANKYLVNLDIDKFKMINLIYGVRTGDQLLKSVSDIFYKTLPGDQLYRYHADIFVAILEGDNLSQATEKLRKFIAALRSEVEEARLPEFTISCGICPMEKFSQISVIYSNAVLAKNEVKTSITECYKCYDEALEVQVEYRNIELSFKEAIKNKEFKVWYQPKFDMENGRIFGAEALARWQKANGEMVLPADFIPVFENTGQIVELDEEVLRIVCADIRNAREEGLEITPISINLSKLHLMKTGIVEKIRQITEEFGINGEDISFEITESISINDKEMMDRLVEAIHRMGFRVDMDDYGTGSSTLWSLSDTSFDTLKLDKTFVDEIGSEKMNIILQSTINLAKHLRMEIVAEGVENEEQVQFLLAQGCRIAQGFYFARPMDKESYIQKIKEQNRK